MATTTARRRSTHPMSYYRNLVKDMDDSQKLELVSIIIDSMRSTKSDELTMEEMLEGYPYKRYTKAELNAMLDEAEAEFAAGGGIDDEDAWDDLEEELALEKQELEMAQSVGIIVQTECRELALCGGEADDAKTKFMKLKWQTKAKASKTAIANYIRHEFGAKRKIAFLQQVKQTTDLLKRSPGIGQIDPLFSDRAMTYRSVIINGLNKLVYFVKDDTIFIAGFWDTRMDDEDQAAQVK